MHTCTKCRKQYNTPIEAKACAFRDTGGMELPSLDFVKPLGHEGEHFNFVSNPSFQTIGWTRPVNVETTFGEVDPELLELLTGMKVGENGVISAFDGQPPTFAVEVHYTKRRTFWQWLLRKPKPQHRVVIPNATIEQTEES